MGATALGEAIIDLEAYRHNLEWIRAVVAPAELMAVVKGDAYGHGLLPIARTAISQGVSRLGALEPASGLALRHAGIGREISIFAWLLAPDEDYREVVDAGIELGVSRLDELRAIAECGASEPARLHLKIDTGLHRNGSTTGDWPLLVREAVRLESAGLVELYGVWTHIAEASGEEDTAAVRRFEEAIRVAENLGASFSVRHLAASAAGFAREDCRFDLVRMGAFTFGISPGGGIAPAALGLVPVLTLSADVAEIVRHGDQRFAVVPLGSAHGVPTGAEGTVAVGGKRYPIVGRVERHQFAIDLGESASVQVGDSVVIFGRDDRGEPTLNEWADACGTIGEELAVRIGPAVARLYAGQSSLGQSSVGQSSLGQSSLG